MYRWALRRSRRDPVDLVNRFPKLRDWMDGQHEPTLKQVEDFAQATGTAVGYFFLPEPPNEQIPIPDLRTIEDRQVDHPSGDLLDTIYQCQQRQEWYRDHARRSGLVELEWVGSLQPSTRTREAADEMTAMLSFSADQRGANFIEAFSKLRDHAEGVGALVMVSGVVGSNVHRRLDPQEFRGFALADAVAPLVFVNSSDTRAAQIFTLAHELAHIWLGHSALDSADLGTRSTNEVERWCNQVAAEMLVPMGALRDKFNAREELSAELQRLARMFKSSRLVVLRRIYEADFLTWDEYRRAYRAEYEQAMEKVSRPGGDFYKAQPVRVSKIFAQAVIASTLEGHTTYTEAFQMLGFKKSSTFYELANRLGVT